METTTRKATLADVDRLDTMVRGSLLLIRRIGNVTVYGVPNSNDRGDRWHDCHLETERRIYDHFELTGTPYTVGRTLDREVRDFVNGPGDYA